MDTLEFLSMYAPFNGLRGDDLCGISSAFHLREFPAGATLVDQDKTVEQFGIIESGLAGLVIRGRDGREVAFGSLEPGDFFGGMAVFGEGLSMISVRCKKPTVCYVQTRENFSHMIEKDPAIKAFLNEIAMDRIKAAYQALAGSGLGNVLDLSVDTSPKRLRAIEKSLLFIEQNLTEPLTLDEVSRVNGMSKYHFARIFKTATGCSFKQYLNRKRIDLAKSLMKDNDMNVTDTCFETGFNDLSYFSRVFQRLEGMRPSSYRRRLKDGAYR